MQIGMVIILRIIMQNLKSIVEIFCMVTEGLASIKAKERILISSFSTDKVFICHL